MEPSCRGEGGHGSGSHVSGRTEPPSSRNRLSSSFKNCLRASTSPIIEAKEWFVTKVANGFENLGYCVYDHAWKFIIIPMVLCLLLSIGMLFRVPELDMELLYSLPVSPSVEAKWELNRIFPSERITYIFAVSDDGSGLLSRTHMNDLNQFWDKLMDLQVPRSLAAAAATPGDTSVSEWLLANAESTLQFDEAYKFSRAGRSKKTPPVRDIVGNSSLSHVLVTDVCIRDPWDDCKTSNPLELYATERLWGAPIRARDYPNFVNFKSAQGYRLDSMMGNITKEKVGSTTTVYNATAFAFRLDLNGNPEMMPFSAAWEQGLITLLDRLKLPGVQFYIKTERSINDELSVASQLQGEDLLRLVLASVFVCFFTVFMNSSKDKYRSKWFSSFVGVSSTVLAYGGGVGLCHMLGMRHVPPAEGTPFLVLGIGVDDVFVVVNAYSLTYMHSGNARRRIGLTLRDSGISITITTLTNIMAFAIGATSVYYSIYVFCILTAAGLLAGYVLCLTLFLGVLSLDARREMKYRTIPMTFPEEEGQATERSESKSLPKVTTASSALSTRSAASTDRLENAFPAQHSPTQRFEHQSPIESLHSTPSRIASPEVSSPHVTSPATTSSTVPQTEAAEAPLAPGVYFVEDLDNHLVVTELVSRVLNDKRSAWRARRKARKELLNSYVGSLSGRFKSSAEASTKDDVEMPCEKAMTTADDFDENLSSEAPQLMSSPTERKPEWFDEAIASPAARSVAGSVQSNAVSKVSVTTRHSEQRRLVRVGQKLIPYEKVDFSEPKGTVGALARKFFMNYYGPFLMRPLTKFVVILMFLATLIYGCFGSWNVQAGLSLKDVTPFHSYLRDFYHAREQYFDAYGDEVVVFFPNDAAWWDPNVQNAMLDISQKIQDASFTVFVRNGMKDFLDEHRDDLVEKTEAEFISFLLKWFETPRGQAFATSIKVVDGKLESWKFYYWMKYLDNTRVSISWIQYVQNLLLDAEASGHFKGHVFTPLAVMWETDPVIFSATMSNMGVALLTMAAVASLLIPDLRSAFMVLTVIVMIDIDVFGFMPLWGLNLNMLTMVNLVISIGFAVDYTAHITHCFTHCKGRTRNHRVIETLVLMGLPVTDGMISTYAAVAMLATADKYALVVTFQMMTSVLAFAFLHGVILMPVLLSLIGPFHQRVFDTVVVADNSIRKKDDPEEDNCRFASVTIEEGSENKLDTRRHSLE